MRQLPAGDATSAPPACEPLQNPDQAALSALTTGKSISVWPTVLM
jgi:hypothetical protein